MSMKEFVYILVHKKKKKETILCFQRTQEDAQIMLRKLVDDESSLLSSNGTEIYNSGNENSISLYQTEAGFLSQALSLKITFSIYKISDKPHSDISEVFEMP